MGTLAYDPERLGMLATALTAAADALDALHCPDPEAQPALATVQAARDACLAWAGTAVALAGCNVLEGYQPHAIEPGSIALALQRVLSAGYGWTITTDPSGSTWSTPPVMQAAALGRLITGGQYSIGTAEARDALRTQLQTVLATPEAVQALLANTSIEALAELAIRLGDERAVLVATGGGPPGSALGGDGAKLDEVVEIDAMFAALGSIVIDPTEPLAAAQATLAQFRPFAAAFVVANLQAPDDVVQPLAIDAFTRYQASLDDPDDPAAWWERPDPLAAGIGQVLFPRITLMPPPVANEFVTSIAAVHPTLLTHTVNDPPTLAALLSVATDPAAVGVTAAGAVIVPLLRFLRERPGIAQPASVDGLNQAFLTPLPYLGAIIAPWLMQFGGRPTDWGWDKHEAAEAFRFVVHDGTSWQSLLDAQDHWGDAMLLLDGSDIGDLQTNLVEIATMMGALGTLLSMRAADRARADRFVWDLFVDKVPAAINKAIGKAGVAGLPAKISSRLVSLAVSLGATQAEQHGALGAPRPLGEVLAELDLNEDAAMAVGAYVAMGVKIEALIAAGHLPADTGWPPEPVDANCPSGDYIEATQRWLDEHITDDLARGAVGDARGAFIGGGQSAGECIELTTS